MYTTTRLVLVVICKGIWHTDVGSSSLAKFLSDKSRSQPDIQVNMCVYHVTAVVVRSIYDVQKTLESREKKY